MGDNGVARIKGQFYAPQDYLAKLSEDDVGLDLGFVGLIKPSGEGASLHYAHPSSCDRWVEVPLDMIESIEHLGQRTCGDHSHPLVRLNFVQPDSAPHATFLSLASLHHDMSFAPQTLEHGFLRGCPPGEHPCYDAGQQKWTCCKN